MPWKAEDFLHCWQANNQDKHPTQSSHRSVTDDIKSPRCQRIFLILTQVECEISASSSLAGRETNAPLDSGAASASVNACSSTVSVNGFLFLGIYNAEDFPSAQHIDIITQKDHQYIIRRFTLLINTLSNFHRCI